MPMTEAPDAREPHRRSFRRAFSKGSSVLENTSQPARPIRTPTVQWRRQMSQAKKVAIVTGASRGIGAAIAERLAWHGFAVVINYAGNTAAAEEVRKRIEDSSGE